MNRQEIHLLAEMLAKLREQGDPSVYGRYSFRAIPTIPRWRLALYERMA